MDLLRAFSTLGCPDYGADEVFGLARSHGFSAVELRCLAGSLDLPAALSEAFGTPTRFAAALSDAGLRVVSLDTSFHLVGDPAAAREALVAHVPWAEAAGVPSLRIFDGGKDAGDAYFEKAAETLQWWSSIRREAGWTVDVAVETHDHLVTTESIVEAVRRLPAIRLLWDSHHTWRQGGEDPIRTWEAIARWVAHIHVKDSISSPSERLPYTYVVPGKGEFQAKPLLERLRRDGFRGAVSLEWEKKWHPALPSLEEALEAATLWWS